MKRRTFIQSLATMVALPTAPTLSLGSATAAIPAATAVPAQARFWSIYMSALHGECPPHALQAMTNIPAADAKRYVTQLIAEGVIKPNPLLKNSVSKVLKSNEDSLLDKVKKRSEMKAQAKTGEVKIVETVESADALDNEKELLGDCAEDKLETVSEDEHVETETQTLDKIILQS